MACWLVLVVVVAAFPLVQSQFPGRAPSNGLVWAYEFLEAENTNPTVIAQPQAFDSARNLLGPLNISPSPKATELRGSVGVKAGNIPGSTTETIVSSLTASTVLQYHITNFTLEFWIAVSHSLLLLSHHCCFAVQRISRRKHFQFRHFDPWKIDRSGCRSTMHQLGSLRLPARAKHFSLCQLLLFWCPSLQLRCLRRCSSWIGRRATSRCICSGFELWSQHRRYTQWCIDGGCSRSCIRDCGYVIELEQDRPFAHWSAHDQQREWAHMERHCLLYGLLQPFAVQP